jgi:hypothetical protein
MAKSWVDQIHTEFVDVEKGTKLLFVRRSFESIVTVEKVTARFLNLNNGKRVRRSDGQTPGTDYWDRAWVRKIDDAVRLRLNKKAAESLLRRTLKALEDGAYNEQLANEQLTIGFS